MAVLKTRKWKGITEREAIVGRGDWVMALHATDEGNKEPLIALLRSEYELTPKFQSYLADLVERGVTKPVSPPQRPQAIGLSANDPWVAAVDAVARGEKKALVKLLQSADAIPHAARGYVADLIERGIAKPKGRPRTPAYTWSTAEGALWEACGFVRNRNPAEGVDDAIANIAKVFGMSEALLRKYYLGKGRKIPAHPPAPYIPGGSKRLPKK